MSRCLPTMLSLLVQNRLSWTRPMCRLQGIRWSIIRRGLPKSCSRAVLFTGFIPRLPAEAMTAAFVVTWKGQLIAERYGPGITAHTPLESWSMGKSMIAALFGILVKQGDYDLSQPAPIPEWQAPDDPRAEIRIADLLH